ncbi:MAG: hypothetical protein WC895_04775 [Candidatus Shapirobacteria bacterium]|jgi:hypothetical protein
MAGVSKKPVDEILRELGYDKPIRRGIIFVIEDGNVFMRFNEKTNMYEAWTLGAFSPEVWSADPDEFAVKLLELV